MLLLAGILLDWLILSLEVWYNILSGLPCGWDGWWLVVVFALCG